jgi:hypothetical protein
LFNFIAVEPSGGQNMSPHIFFTLSLDLMLRELKEATGAYVIDILSLLHFVNIV